MQYTVNATYCPTCSWLLAVASTLDQRMHGYAKGSNRDANHQTGAVSMMDAAVKLQM